MSRFGLAAVAALSMLAAGFGAQAANLAEVDFTISGTWFQITGSDGPYGLSTQPTITGSFMVDLDQLDHLDIPGVGISDVQLQVGSRLFTDADLNAALSDASFTPGPTTGIATLTNFDLMFDSHDYADSVTAQFNDGVNDIAINVRATITSPPVTVPFAGHQGGVAEPSTWALLITGFGLLGVALRRRGSLWWNRPEVA